MADAPAAIPEVSIIIPAHNAAGYLEVSLPALKGSSFQDLELLVVDDRSTDGTRDVAERNGARVLTNAQESGQGGARNTGMGVARGAILMFLDADVVVHPDTVQRMREAFAQRPEIAAVFGSYDDEPADRSVVSTFKNLFHHHVHQKGAADATTFWTGCGAIRREVFERFGGFKKAGLELIEDIEYGHRLVDAGERIWLRPDIQVKHLKRWTLGGLVRTDVFLRGIPWTRMLLRRGSTEKDLNFTWRQKVCTVLACMVGPLGGQAGGMMALGGSGLWWMLPVAAVVLVVWMNSGLFALFARKRGVLFAVGCVPLLLLYYHYSVFSFVTGAVLHVAGGKRVA